MDENKKDPNLQAPQEANTTKHVNFREVDETDRTSSADAERDGSDENESPTKKAWEELREENKDGGSK